MLPLNLLGPILDAFEFRHCAFFLSLRIHLDCHTAHLTGTFHPQYRLQLVQWIPIARQASRGGKETPCIIQVYTVCALRSKKNYLRMSIKNQKLVSCVTFREWRKIFTTTFFHGFNIIRKNDMAFIISSPTREERYHLCHVTWVT